MNNDQSAKECRTCTHTGIMFPYASFTSTDISLDDIAHHLSMTCRFGGAVDEFFSVAEHCLHCLDIRQLVDLCSEGDCIIDAPYDYRIRILILLHDAHEAYTGDMPTGLKKYLGTVCELQKRLDVAVYEHFDIEPPTEEEQKLIKAIDIEAMIAEARALMPVEMYNLFLQDYGYGNGDKAGAKAPKVYRDTRLVERIYKDKLQECLYWSK